MFDVLITVSVDTIGLFYSNFLPVYGQEICPNVIVVTSCIVPYVGWRDLRVPVSDKNPIEDCIVTLPKRYAYGGCW